MGDRFAKDKMIYSGNSRLFMIHLQMNIQCHDILEDFLAFLCRGLFLPMWTLNLTGFVIQFFARGRDTFEKWLDFGMFGVLIDLTTNHDR